VTEDPRGWFELLYRESDAPFLSSMEDVKQEYYRMHGGQVATAEFPTVFEIYEHFGEERKGWTPPDTLPRAMRHGDALNICLKYPGRIGIVTFVVLKKETLVQFMRADEEFQKLNNRVNLDPNFNQVLAPVRYPFDSMLNQNLYE